MKRSTLWWTILLISFTSIESYPSKPLNERSTDLNNWQAWLLIDQNNRQQTDLNMLRRRITPKSVFIAPTFSPDTLPACADGYRSDSMGRCVKIIRIDEAAHLNFLLQRLNEQFADYDDDGDEPAAIPASASTPGPYQLNIPLFNNNDYDNETDMAIIVAPTKSTSLKLDVKKIDNNKFNANNIAAMIGVKPEDLETTTITDFITTTSRANPTTTIDFATTTIEDGDRGEESTTTITTTETETTNPTTLVETTTETTETIQTEEGDALYFRWRF